MIILERPLNHDWTINARGRSLSSGAKLDETNTGAFVESAERQKEGPFAITEMSFA